MKIVPQRLTCLSCSEVFDADLVVDAPIDVAVAAMKAVRCLKCGSRKVGLGGSYADAPPVTMPLDVRLAWWHARGDVGVSSETIASAFTGGKYLLWPDADADIPHDPEDFQRCKALLDLIPEWRADLAKVAAAYPWYQPFIDRWAEMEALLAEETKGKKRKSKLAPRLYDLMQVAEAESLKLRYPLPAGPDPQPTTALPDAADPGTKPVVPEGQEP